MIFSDAHEFMTFEDEWKKMSWWKGKLVKSKYKIRSGLFEPKIPVDCVGIVTDIYQGADCSDNLVVVWAIGRTSNQVSKHEVYVGEER